MNVVEREAFEAVRKAKNGTTAKKIAKHSRFIPAAIRVGLNKLEARGFVRCIEKGRSWLDNVFMEVK